MREVVFCEGCGDVIPFKADSGAVYPISAYLKRKYCTRACWYKELSRQLTLRREHKQPNCQQCGGKISPRYPSGQRRYNAVFCSIDCKRRGYKKK